MSGVEWVPGRWDAVEVGQTVTLRNADGAEVQITIATRSGQGSIIAWVRSGSCRYLADDWDLFVNASPLPTEPGIYFPRSTFAPGIRIVKFADGQWRNASGGELDAADLRWLRDVQARGDLTFFEPVPVTAKRVLDAVRNVLTLPTDGRRPNGEYVITSTDIEPIAAGFGVAL